jgi:hypothetical protein
MKRQNLPKIDKLSQVVFNNDASLHLEQYFIRYLAFQDKIVRSIKSDSNKILIS